MDRRQLARLTPVAFLLAVTIAVLLIRSGLHSGPGVEGTSTFGPVTSASTATGTAARTRTSTGAAGESAAGRYYTVRKGDTLDAIAARVGTTIAKLEALNPSVNPTTLQVGQKIRVK